MNKKIIAGIFTFSLLFTLCTSSTISVYAEDSSETKTESSSKNNDPVVYTGYVLPTSECASILLNRYFYCNDVESVGIMYSTDSDLTIDVKIKEVTGYFFTFSASLRDLQSDTTYYYQAFVNTADGQILGEIKSFKTLKPLNVTTGDAVSVTSTSATIENNEYRNISLAFRTGIGYSTTSTDNAEKKVTCYKLSGYSLKLTNLEPDTTYYYYTFVQTLYGNIFKGELKSFTTLPK